MSQRCKKTRATSLRRPFCSLNILPKFKMTGVSERGRRKLYFDPTVVTVSQKLADLYSLTSLFSGFFCRSNSSQPHIYNACVHNPVVLYLLSVTALQKDEGNFPWAGRFVAEIFVNKLKWRVSQRWADVSYILIQLLLLYLKNLLSYTAWHNYFQAFVAVQIPRSHIFLMRVYTIPLYYTCSLSQRCKKTRGYFLRRPVCSQNICPTF